MACSLGWDISRESISFHQVILRGRERHNLVSGAIKTRPVFHYIQKGLATTPPLDTRPVALWAPIRTARALVFDLDSPPSMVKLPPRVRWDSISSMNLVKVNPSACCASNRALVLDLDEVLGFDPFSNIDLLSPFYLRTFRSFCHPPPARSLLTFSPLSNYDHNLDSLDSQAPLKPLGIMYTRNHSGLNDEVHSSLLLGDAKNRPVGWTNPYTAIPHRQISYFYAYDNTVEVRPNRGESLFQSLNEEKAIYSWSFYFAHYFAKDRSIAKYSPRA